MYFEEFRKYCLEKPFVTEGFPFDQSTIVFKVGGKLFFLADIDQFTAINLKANPEKAIEQRERYSGIMPGYHMNKKHWNTVQVQSDVPMEVLLQMIDDSYDLVYASLSKKIKHELTLG
jgi:predicted DNA-binding protein (MmcQ/YjbR family)